MGKGKRLAYAESAIRDFFVVVLIRRLKRPTIGSARAAARGARGRTPVPGTMAYLLGGLYAEELAHGAFEGDGDDRFVGVGTSGR